MPGTPTMRVCSVTSGEDFTVFVTTDESRMSLDVEAVPCGARSDARVRVTTDPNADEVIRIVAGSF